MLTIGAFAKACRLSPKALRLYDELDLLRPARVDPDTGYRYYAPEQLERARLVAWLRRLGMPLARIRQVCALDPGGAAREIRAYWARVEAETTARRDLALFLVDHLIQSSQSPQASQSSASSPSSQSSQSSQSSRKDTIMLELRYSALSDTGLVRDANQDTAYAGARVLAVADGCGAGGASASTAAVEALKFLDEEPLPAGGVLNILEDAVQGAGQAVQDVAAAVGGSARDEIGTTLTAAVWTGSQLALVHIGDSRAYLLRDGELFLITHDHTVVQSLVDEGRLTPEEATVHPQRALLIKALTGGGPVPDPDLKLHDARPGDRYLLCSDGLSTVVPTEEVRRLLAAAPDPQAAVRALVDAANAAGGPDNVSCVVADVVEAGRQ
ncbi:MerR family transcriptional regulator [Streptomyces avermitilis]|uniref:MerR family transcriptional regulator n=1 Tax=Streptomyces avermitilis TaxID=33903 RepID=UPI0036966283